MSSDGTGPDSGAGCDADAASSSSADVSLSASNPSPAPSPSRTARPNSALSKSASTPRKRAKVSFSEEVLAKDKSGEGSNVTIKEEHGVFLGPLLGRMVVSSDAEKGDGMSDGSDKKPTASAPSISFANDALTNEKISYGESPGGILKSSSDLGDESVQYDNLIVRMGLLKCGHRYKVVVPIPDYWKENDAGTDATKTKEEEVHVRESSFEVRVAEDSIDDDLRGEVQTEYSTTEDSPLCTLQYNVCIKLAAKRRGPYRGRFLLELTRCKEETDSQPTATEAITDTKLEAKPDPSMPAESATPQDASNAGKTPDKCLMSIQVDATVMGPNMGTPKLRNGVVCLGKIVGYDSDEETEWQGFD
ncbi:hypothetical protein ACHAXT_012206 [Thalassiosira profunda]